MKIILTQDVKGKGKAGDIVECAMGYANFLLSKKQAVLANDENLKALDEKKAQDLENAKKHLEEMKQLKQTIDGMKVVIVAKLGQNGKMFGSISTKEVVSKFMEQNGIELDKRKILYDKLIDALGDYDLPIQLHKEVLGTIHLSVIRG